MRERETNRLQRVLRRIARTATMRDDLRQRSRRRGRINRRRARRSTAGQKGTAEHNGQPGANQTRHLDSSLEQTKPNYPCYGSTVSKQAAASGSGTSKPPSAGIKIPTGGGLRKLASVSILPVLNCGFRRRRSRPLPAPIASTTEQRSTSVCHRVQLESRNLKLHTFRPRRPLMNAKPVPYAFRSRRVERRRQPGGPGRN